MDTRRLSDLYMQAVIALGCVAVFTAALTIDISRADVYLALFSAFMLAVGSRITVRLPRFKTYISVSDTFIFLILLLYGGPFAVLLAAAEAAASAWRFCNRKLTVAFNAATMAVSTSAVVLVLNLSGFYTTEQMHGHDGHRQDFIICLSLIALTQFIVNTSLAAFYDLLKERVALWETWKRNYIWTFFSYLIGAAAAGMMIQLSDMLGIGIILATFPIIVFVFLAYRMYLKNVDISVQQAEQAEQYARILEAQSDALRESEERFRSAFDNAPIGIGLASPNGKWLKVNRALSDILGYTEADFLDTDFQSITIPEDLGAALFKIHELLNGKVPSYQMEQRYIHKTGRTVWTSQSASAANDSKAGQPNLIFQIQDITDKKMAEEKLQYEATHDALTGLPNRLYFMNRLGVALERALRVEDHQVSVLFIDLDRFKNVNDSLGHLAGDDLLKEISCRLRDCMRPADVVARLGGDEFTILVEGKFETAEVSRIAARIQEKFRIPFELQGHEIYSSASIGILHASEKHLSPEDVMRDADTAMYQAKRAGKARHEVFDEIMHNEAKETLKLETELRRAVERGEIDVWYQPIYDLGSGKIDAFEALSRWHHPELGEIPAQRFIALAEEIGLIDELCETILLRSCGEIGVISNQSNDGPFNLSVNLSCQQFSQDGLPETVAKVLAASGFSAERLKLEITESVFFEHQDRAIEMLNTLRSTGIEINIDDFGTGYSNLGYLKRLPITALKIDRSFVAMIDEEGNHDEIVKTIVTLARNLGLRVVAEGVETPTQLRLLKELGCEGAQGYFLAPPMNLASLKNFLGMDATYNLLTPEFGDISTVPLLH